MAKGLFPGSPWIRRLSKKTTSCQRQLSSQATPIIPLQPAHTRETTVEEFRGLAFKPQKPMLFGRLAGSPSEQLPAMHKWFKTQSDKPTALSTYMNQFQGALFPYEVFASTSHQKRMIPRFREWISDKSEPADELLGRFWHDSFEDLDARSFFQLHAPLRLLYKALEFNQSLSKEEKEEPLRLYIAQSSLSDLPPELQKDVPTPELIRRVGKGDVYSSSIWLGTEPTYTPLHRDPNPNLFCQLCSSKVIRLMAPKTGDMLYSRVQTRLQKQGNSRIRTEDMMQGEEREALFDAVWGEGSLPKATYEAHLGRGDALFIPNGWWHSVKSLGDCGHLNGSVNWWFR
ncbi:hypothetical protein F66182_251 [Fusarium sp. NRRL 66182]|nr:hypothetical protein F66182_251 [Fusarium sp. NRRL 66182]